MKENNMTIDLISQALDVSVEHYKALNPDIRDHILAKLRAAETLTDSCIDRALECDDAGCEVIADKLRESVESYHNAGETK